MQGKLIEIEGDWWPAKDKQAREAVMKNYRDVDYAVKLCTGKKVAIQAGGNCGIWARYMAKIFETVYTFEPDIENFLCLNLNAPQKNIVRMQAALGIRRPPVSVEKVSENVGAHFIGGAGIIPHIMVDDLQLTACDLIQLDVEGYEYFALAGAAKTIEKYRPVLMLEDKLHHLRYQVSRETLMNWLGHHHYCLFQKINRDIILVPKERGLCGLEN